MPRTPREIIEETVLAYSTPGTRALSSKGTCVYLDAHTGNRCDFGRCMTDDAIAQHGGSGSTCFDLACNAAERLRISDRQWALNTLLRPEYRGYPIEFWRGVQRLHDEPANWTYSEKRNGLSERGRIVAETLISAFVGMKPNPEWL